MGWMAWWCLSLSHGGKGTSFKLGLKEEAGDSEPARDKLQDSIAKREAVRENLIFFRSLLGGLL